MSFQKTWKFTKRPPLLREALERIETIYRPYHNSLRRLIAETAVQFGYSILVDCHSMPSLGQKSDTKSRPDIIIGDRYGTSCHGDISRELVKRFSDLGYNVTRNKPYAGGFITEHYGRPLKGLHAVQIEINRRLYMDEQALCLTDGFETLRDDIKSVISHLVSLPDLNLDPIQVAAE